MRNNNQSNTIIKWIVIIGDFILLNFIIFVGTRLFFQEDNWPDRSLEIFILVNNIALILSQLNFSTIIHQRFVGAGDIVRKIVGLSALQSILAYVFLKVFDYYLSIGWFQWGVGTAFFVCLLISRFIERWIIKLYRESGRNTRAVTFIGNDPELINLYKRFVGDPTKGYRILGYYADDDIGEWTHSIEENKMLDGERKVIGEGQQISAIKYLGTLQYFLKMMDEDPDILQLGDEIYVSLSRRDRDIIKKISRFCDKKVIKFFYVPVSVESIGLNLKRELIDDVDIYTTYDNPLDNMINKFVKRLFDVVLSAFFLALTAIMFPFIWIIIKKQSPGPIFFKQKRTGIDGKEFIMYKFRSMHVNEDADRVQATKDDPRKFAFGNFMRKSNIDEMPQFWNVLKGDMSIVGPRPHMLLHTEQYSELIDRYMVRHFVKPGLTGWAQVTGYRGETKELWQMEGRVKRDIWYMEHWSIWLDIRIIWLTAKSIFVHDKNAY